MSNLFHKTNILYGLKSFLFIFLLIVNGQVFAQDISYKTSRSNGAASQTDSLALSDLKARQNIIKWSAIGVYGIGSYALYDIWYSRFDQSSFHLFNDLGEWENVDKLGHIQASYFQSQLMFNGLKWSGLSNNESILWGSVAGLGFQTTIEIMDGFSSDWGFSMADYAANLIGIGTFAFQQKVWGEQKITLKMSYWPTSYSEQKLKTESNEIYTYKERANSLFGSNIFSRFIKDYNAQTLWLSFHPSLLFENFQWPNWLNISLGYGANNMYGGFKNSWQENEIELMVDDNLFPRHRQYVLALDYDLRKIKTHSPFLRTLLDVLNIFKWPAPAVELTSNGELRFHLIFRN